MKWYHVRHDETPDEPCPACDIEHYACDHPMSCRKEHVVVMWEHEYWGMIPV